MIERRKVLFPLPQEIATKTKGKSIVEDLRDKKLP